MSDTLESKEDLAAAIWPGETPTRVLACRHCAKKNRVAVPTAVFWPESVDCGSCGDKLFLTRAEPLTAISSRAYEHPLDRKSLAALEAVPGFGRLVRWFVANIGERSLRLNLLASNLLVGPDQFPELMELQERAAVSLDLPWRPELYLGESPVLNARTMGVEEAMIVVNSALLDQLSDEELVCVLGHELGHLHSDHILYKTLANMLLSGGLMVSGVLRLLTWPIKQGLMHWNRCSELTADRAGLLATRDLVSSLRTAMKLAGGNRPGTTSRTRTKVAPFIRQTRKLAEMEEGSWADGALAALLAVNQSHPLTAWRVMHLLRWVENGNYLDILAGDYARVARD